MQNITQLRERLEREISEAQYLYRLCTDVSQKHQEYQLLVDVARDLSNNLVSLKSLITTEGSGEQREYKDPSGCGCNKLNCFVCVSYWMKANKYTTKNLVIQEVIELLGKVE